MQSSTSLPPTVRFGVFELDPRAGELRKKGMKVRLQGQPVDILVTLLQRPGETVTREELHKKLWPADTFVDFEQGLNNAMKRLRAALDDDAESPHFIETVPRRGYRFIGAVTGGAGNGAETALAEAQPDAGDKPAHRLGIGTRLAAVGLLSLTVAVFLVAGAALSLIHFREMPLVSAPVQFQISPSGSLPQGDAFAVSPDGHHLAFAATGSDGVARLWIRDLDSLKVRTLSDSHPASFVEPGRVVPPFFWSPDSRFIGFQAGGKLAKIEISGGPAQTLCDVQGTAVGGSWNRDGVIVFADNTRGLMQVSAAGGVASPLTTFDPSRKEVVHVLPSFLPDGRHFLYLRASSAPENSGVYVGSLNAKPEQQDSRRLLPTTSGPVYVPSSDSDSGQVLFLRQATLMAQPFDAHRLELSGEAVPVAAQVGSFIDYGLFSASSNGVLVYRSAVGQSYQLTWLDRQGRLLGTVAEPGGYNSMALSPDGRRVAVSRTNPENTANWDVWLLDLGRNTSTRLTYDQVRAKFPVWSADGNSVIFDAIHEGEMNLYLKLASGAGDDRLLLKSTAEYKYDKYATSCSRDGRFLSFTMVNPETKSDLFVLPLQGDHKPIPFLRTEFNESSGQFSPNGHWIAYISDESGSDEIYVREFSSGSAQGSWEAAGKWLISKGGGTDPRWRGDGKELFYVASDGKLMSVEITTKPVFQAGAPRPLFQLPPGFIGGDVTADGRRFLIGVPVAQSTSVPFTVVLNWQTTLKK